MSIFTPPASVEVLSGLTGSILMFHLKGEKAFYFPSHRLRSRTPLTFQFILPELTLRWEGLFLVPQLAQGVHLLPLDALRTFNLASICLCREVFQSVLACTRSKARMTSSILACTCSKARRTSSILACTRSKARRTSSCLHSLKVEEDFFLPALAQSRGGLFLACTRSKSRRTFSCLHSLKVEEDFFFSCLKTHESVKVFGHHWCLRSPKDDEDFKTLTTAADRRKTMGTLKLLTDAANRQKTMGTLKLLTDAANRRKTMGTLKLLTRKHAA